MPKRTTQDRRKTEQQSEQVIATKQDDFTISVSDAL